MATKHNMQLGASRPKFGPYRSLGKQIFRYREARRLTLTALAKQFKVHKSTVLRWERGFVSVLFRETLRDMVGAKRAA